MNSANPYQASNAPTTEFPPVMASSARPPEAIESLIPYRNSPALISYYTGLFSICPIIGLPLAIAALVLGVVGLRKRRRQSEVKGAAHAWIGIIVGTLGLLINVVIFMGIFVAIATANM
jgi:Domain of unknown function (DUF4190)